MTSLFIEGAPVSWNQVLRKHWRVYKGIKDDLASRTLSAINKMPIEPISTPVTIEVMAHWKTRRLRDIDNICLKPIIDELVRSGILKGDTCDIVKRVTYLGKIDCKREGLSILITPAAYG